MEFTQHMLELRRILVRYFWLFVATYVIVLLLFPHIYHGLISSMGLSDIGVYSFGMGEIIGFFFTAPAVVALLLTFPVFLVMFYTWIRDALFPKEREFITRYVWISAALFLFGIALSFFVTPRLVTLSAGLGNMLGVTVIYSAQEVFNIWLTLSVALGILLQFPILVSLLIRYGIVSKDTLRSVRIFVYPVFYVIAAVITPGDLIVTDVLLLGIFVTLYEGAILLSRENASKI